MSDRNTSCPECSKTFSRSYDIKRHCLAVHGLKMEPKDPQHGRILTRPAPVYSGKSVSTDREGKIHPLPVTLQHPFTMCISGPTSCGKTFLVNKILQSFISGRPKITPTPQRIIWMYKRWQPLYEEIKKAVYPTVEFVQGIPANLEKDEYINPKVRNLIVLDDLMSTASKDQRVTDLFTEGSHHRNLSVIAINQNLYYSKDPTQRRNCHYIVLFSNPVDQQPVMTLARQMYPGDVNRFMDVYRKSTLKPYGYLLVDLKPNTPSEERLIPNALASTKSDQRHCAKDDDEHESVRHPSLKRPWLDFCRSSSEEELNNPRSSSVMRWSRRRKIHWIPCPECGLVLNGTSNFSDHVLKKHSR